MKKIMIFAMAISASPSFAADFQQISADSKPAMKALYDVQGDAALVCKGARDAKPAKNPFDTAWQSAHLTINMNNETTYSVDGNLVSEGNSTIAQARVKDDTIYLVITGPDSDEGAAEVTFSLKEMSGDNAAKLSRAFASVYVTPDGANGDWDAGSKRWETDRESARYTLFCDLE